MTDLHRSGDERNNSLRNPIESKDRHKDVRTNEMHEPLANRIILDARAAKRLAMFFKRGHAADSIA